MIQTLVKLIEKLQYSEFHNSIQSKSRKPNKSLILIRGGSQTRSRWKRMIKKKKTREQQGSEQLNTSLILIKIDKLMLLCNGNWNKKIPNLQLQSINHHLRKTGKKKQQGSEKELKPFLLFLLTQNMQLHGHQNKNINSDSHNVSSDLGSLFSDFVLRVPPTTPLRYTSLSVRSRARLTAMLEQVFQMFDVNAKIYRSKLGSIMGSMGQLAT